MRARDNRRSEQAKAYRWMYFTPEWQHTRKEVLIRDGYQCQRCKVMLTGRHPAPNSPAVNHIDKDAKLYAHRRFEPNECEALCKQCHDGPTQSKERRGYDKTIGADGYPIDEKHPANR